MIFARLLKLSPACGYKLCVLTLNFFVRSRCPVWYEVWIETVGDGGEGGAGGERGLIGRVTGLIVGRWPLFAPCKQRFLGLPVPAGE